jgi:hypothetical protein
MIKTASGLVAYARAQLGLPYWYGTYGKTATEDLLERKAEQYPEQFSASRQKTARAEHMGKRVHDCVGLIKGYMWSDTPTSPPRYAKMQDKNVRGMKSACTVTGPISTIPDVPGVLVFRGTAHVGVYIGGGYVIEARGFNYGVIRSALGQGGWDAWGKLKWIQYETGGNLVATRTLKLATPRMSGDDVAALQRTLNALFGAELVADGSFGPHTSEAVKAAQGRMGLERDGSVGPMTRAALAKAQSEAGAGTGGGVETDEPDWKAMYEDAVEEIEKLEGRIEAAQNALTK